MDKIKTLKKNVLDCTLLKALKPVNGLLLANVGTYNPNMVPFIKQEIETNQKEQMSYLKHNKALQNHYLSMHVPVEYLFSIVVDDPTSTYSEGDLVYTTKNTSLQLNLNVEEYLPNRMDQMSIASSDLTFSVGFYNHLDIVAKIDEELFIQELYSE